MANNESTAVNDLIALVNQPPSAIPPTEELNFDARRPASRPATRTMQPMTHDAAMAPLPRSRAPHSTAMPVPTRRSTAVPPPRPSAQMAAVPPPIPGRPSAQFAVPVAPVAVAPVVAPVVAAAPIAAKPAANAAMLTEPIEQFDLSMDDDADDQAFDGDPEAPVPTSVMAQSEVEQRAESTRLDQGWTPNAAAPLTLDGSELGGGETTPFLTDEPTEEPVRRAAPANFEDSAILSSAALKRPSVSVAAVRAVSPAPGTLRAVSPAPAALVAADLPQLPKAKPSAALNAVTPPAPAPLPWATSIAPNNATEASWFEASRAVPQVDLVPIVPPRVPRPETTAFEKVKRTLPIVSGLAVVGFFVGGYLYFNSASSQPSSNDTAKPVAAQTAPAAKTDATEPAVAAPALVAAEPVVAAEPTAPVAEPAVAAPTPVAAEPAVAAPAVAAPAVAAPAVAAEPVPAPAPAPALAVVTPVAAPALVDVRFDSAPAGATVTLVDRGHTSLIGSTPITAALDPSHTYDIVFSLDGRATTMATLDPSKSKAVRTVLPAIGSSKHSSVNSVSRGETAIAAVAPTPKSTSKSRTTKETPVKATPVKAVKTVAAAAASPTETPAKGGEGIVMISSKPPCEIFVDGKDTGMMTPQRNISLRAGSHTITLVSKANGIKKNIAVQVAAGKSTKLVQDYSALIKK